MATRQRRDRSDSVDKELTDLFRVALESNDAVGKEIALIAVGGYGRAELSPGSDLDIVILHNDAIDNLPEIVNAFLYPLWDSGRAIDHSVRNLSEMKSAIASDLKVALGALNARYIAGNQNFVSRVIADISTQAKKKIPSFLPELREITQERHQRQGELAYLLEPDLKEARGGLRDVTLIRAIADCAEITVPLDRVASAESSLLNIRDALHEVSGRNKDQLFFVEQDKVAELLKFTNADELMAEVARSARTIDFVLELMWHQIDHQKGKNFLKLKKAKVKSLELGLALESNEVVITDSFNIADDPVIGLRAAATAAQLGVPLSLGSCERLAREMVDLPTPWPKTARAELVRLIGAGAAMVRVWEALEQEGVISRIFPEWNHLRSLPQRNVLHRHTVDRHMVETAVKAAALTRSVHRPDLLLIAALFHDLGKGFAERDHSDYGAELMAPLAVRLGFADDDVNILTLLVKHHLLLSATATRRDLDDPATISTVTSAIPDAQTLELLHALSIADGEATGKAAWSDWKATLVSSLVHRCQAAMSGILPAQQRDLSSEDIARAESGELHVALRTGDGDFIIDIVIPDRTGVLALVAGVLSAARCNVRSARTRSYAQSAVMTWNVVVDEHLTPPSEADLKALLTDALNGKLDIPSRIAERIRNFRLLPGIPVPPPMVEVLNDAATGATVVEVRMHDRPGLLYAIASAVTATKVEIKAAIVSTLGAEALDSLYITELNGAELSTERAQSIAKELQEKLQ